MIMKINFSPSKFSSPNFSKRTEKIDLVILHFTEMDFNGALSRLCNPKSEVSAHYLIKNNGEIFQLVDDHCVAWHAGKSYWKGREKINQTSIGIELDNLGNHEFSIKQMRSCLALCKELAQKYKLPPESFIGHSDIAPDRKIDPGLFFDWKLMHQNGFGIWHDLAPSDREDKILYEYGDESPHVINLQRKLKQIGYKITINGVFDNETNYVVRAFQSKFYPELIKKLGLKYYNDPKSRYVWTEFSQKILNNLSQKFL